MVTDRCSNGSRTPHRRGFTLIEILVVVAIIALLISILLPSLSKARDQAKAVACSSNLRQIGTGEATYQSQSKEWIPGSPLTTGISWVMTHTSSVSQWNPITSGFNRLSLGLYDYATPIRAALFGSKSIPSGAASGDWASANKAIWLQATTGMFACPSNPERYGPYNASGWPIIQASSYLTSSNLMRGGPDLYDKVGPTGNGQYYAQGSTWEVAAPNGYRPRHSRLARESMKVFMADGYRYFDNATGDKDYDPNPSGLFSSFSSSNPPALAGTYAREYGQSRKFSYRHRGGRSIDAVFFDSHVEALTVDFRGLNELGVGYSGTAVEPKRWYPTGSTINNPGVLHKPPAIGPGTATLP